jgi:hypothetical protein
MWLQKALSRVHVDISKISDVSAKDGRWGIGRGGAG